MSLETQKESFHRGYCAGLAGHGVPPYDPLCKGVPLGGAPVGNWDRENPKYLEGWNLGCRHRVNGRRLKGY
jgi:hypothetical protein